MIETLHHSMIHRLESNYECTYSDLEWDNFSNITELYTLLGSDECYKENNSTHSNIHTDGAYIRNSEHEKINSPCMECGAIKKIVQRPEKYPSSQGHNANPALRG